MLNSLKDNPQDPFLPNEETSFLVFANEPTIVFNLRDYLLVLVQIFNQRAICYCESKCPIELSTLHRVRTLTRHKIASQTSNSQHPIN